MPEKSKQYMYAELMVGQKAQFDFLLTTEVIADFAQLSGDVNPLHTDATYAATTEFGRPIAHGMIAGTLFSRFVGMELPGKYSVYLSQTLTFHRPMFAGDILAVSGEITHKSDATRTITLATKVRSASGELLADGLALVRVLR